MTERDRVLFGMISGVRDIIYKGEEIIDILEAGDFQSDKLVPLMEEYGTGGKTLREKVETLYNEGYKGKYPDAFCNGHVRQIKGSLSYTANDIERLMQYLSKHLDEGNDISKRSQIHDRCVMMKEEIEYMKSANKALIEKVSYDRRAI